MGKIVEGKVVVVTGSGAGIGRDFALAFAANGAKVVVNDVSPPSTASRARPRGSLPRSGSWVARPLQAPTASPAPDSASKIVQAAMDTFGRIDCIVNNAGIVRDRFFFNMSVDEWKAVVDVHLNGSFYVAARRGDALQAAGLRQLRAHDVDVRPDRQLRPGELLGRKDGRRRAVEVDRTRHGQVQRALELHRAVGLDGDDRDDPGRHPREHCAHREDEKDGVEQDCAACGYLASDQAAKVTGQIFGVRANEIYFFSQIRMTRSVHRSGGWTPEDIAEHAMPAFESSFYPNVPSMTLTPWDPI